MDREPSENDVCIQFIIIEYYYVTIMSCYDTFAPQVCMQTRLNEYIVR